MLHPLLWNFIPEEGLWATFRAVGFGLAPEGAGRGWGKSGTVGGWEGRGVVGWVFWG